MAKPIVHRKAWTKEDIKLVLRLWEETTTEELAEKLGVSHATVYYIAKEIRKVNPKLIPKKSRKGVLQGLIREVLAK